MADAVRPPITKPKHRGPCDARSPDSAAAARCSMTLWGSSGSSGSVPPSADASSAAVAVARTGRSLTDRRKVWARLHVRVSSESLMRRRYDRASRLLLSCDAKGACRLSADSAGRGALHELAVEHQQDRGFVQL